MGTARRPGGQTAPRGAAAPCPAKERGKVAQPRAAGARVSEKCLGCGAGFAERCLASAQGCRPLDECPDRGRSGDRVVAGLAATGLPPCWRRCSGVIFGMVLFVRAWLDVHPISWPEGRRAVGRVRSQPAPPRLGQPGHLPRPPVTSEFYAEWFRDGGVLLAGHQNIYRQKFDAYYGKSVSETGDIEGSPVRIETMFPVFLLTATLTVSWTAVLWNLSVPGAPKSVWDLLKFGFLGAYAFILQMLIRRFFQSDLRPSAYAHSMLRIIIVLIIVTALYQLLPPSSLRTDAAVAFIVGFFPLVGMQALQRTAAAALRVAVPSLSQPYPLNQIDGLTIWYEARLLEAGIEDMQSLATANIVDVILHIRVPVGRIVDWVDQAHLYLQLDRIERGRFEQWLARHGKDRRRETAARDSARRETADRSGAGTIVQGSATDNDRAGTQTRTALRQFGIRKATDMLKAFPP